MRKYLQGYLKNIPGPEIMFQDLDLLICLFLHLGPEKKTYLIKLNSSLNIFLRTIMEAPLFCFIHFNLNPSAILSAEGDLCNGRFRLRLRMFRDFALSYDPSLGPTCDLRNWKDMIGIFSCFFYFQDFRCLICLSILNIFISFSFLLKDAKLWQ